MNFVIWTGAAWESWSHESPREGGIGGSETASVSMARELSRLGHQVTVYGQFVKGKDGEHDGVKYVQFSEVVDPGQISCDVFVSSRDINALLLKPAAKVTAVWVHDINLGPDSNDRLDKFDLVLCLSKWSARTIESFYPHVRKSKISVTRNGIDIARFSPEKTIDEILALKEKPARFTYSSSPDRGLGKLLDFWPAIQKIEPGASLHVYYGFDNWRKMARGMQSQINAIDWFEERLWRMKDQGVQYHGRVGQQELADSFLSSLLWLYPTDFKETSCISAMEAQAAGAVPVCTALAALNETVTHGALIKPFNMEPRYEKDFLEAVTKLLVESPNERIRLASEGREAALKNLSWADVAKSWISLFEKKILEKNPTA